MSLVRDALMKIGDGTSNRTESGYGPPVSNTFQKSPNLKVSPQNLAKLRAQKSSKITSNPSSTTAEALREVFTGERGLVSGKSRKLLEENNAGRREFTRGPVMNIVGNPGK